jgi:hypothetical protein
VLWSERTAQTKALTPVTGPERQQSAGSVELPPESVAGIHILAGSSRAAIGCAQFGSRYGGFVFKADWIADQDPQCHSASHRRLPDGC